MWEWLADLFTPDLTDLLPLWVQWALVGIVLVGFVGLWLAFR